MGCKLNYQQFVESRGLIHLGNTIFQERLLDRQQLRQHGVVPAGMATEAFASQAHDTVVCRPGTYPRCDPSARPTACKWPPGQTFPVLPELSREGLKRRKGQPREHALANSLRRCSPRHGRHLDVEDEEKLHLPQQSDQGRVEVHLQKTRLLLPSQEPHLQLLLGGFDGGLLPSLVALQLVVLEHLVQGLMLLLHLPELFRRFPQCEVVERELVHRLVDAVP